jgi:4-amino-4-deoxy-L-arabinose transferase-like glycosyltransferase
MGGRLIAQASTHPGARFSWRYWGSLLAAVLAATLLRARPLLDNRFHPDEALYASFSRLIASGRDPLLAGVLVDKPPLSFYLTAFSFLVFGSTEFAARLAPFYASLVSVALLFGVARRLYDPLTAQLSAWGLALSPFAILFSITIFVDTLLVALALGGWWILVRAHRWPSTRRSLGWAGGALALAFATKQTALALVPLVLAFTLPVLPAGPREALRRLGRIVLVVVAGLAVSAGLIFLWDAARHAPIGFWEQGYADNAPGRFVRADEVIPRARAWLDWLQYFTASWPLNLLFAAGVPLLLVAGARRPSLPALADFLLADYLGLYLACYWLLAFNVWDRYLLPLMPLLALLLARVMVLFGSRAAAWAGRLARWPGNWNVRVGTLLSAGFVFLLVPSAVTAARSGYPVGGDHGAYDGLDDAAHFIRTLPAGGVLYDHWLSWEWSFYLFDGPLYVSWFPTPEGLRNDLRAFGRTSPRYLAAPAWESETEIRAAAAEAGFAFVRLHTSYRRDGAVTIAVYQLVPLP